MKPIFPVISFILILVGMICISTSNLTVKVSLQANPERREVELIKNVTLSWSPLSDRLLKFTADLEKGDIIYMDISEPAAWGEFSEGDMVDDFKPIAEHIGPFFVYVDFNYTSESGQVKTTQFEIVYYYDVKRSLVVKGPFRPVHIYMNRSETLTVENPENSTIISGTVKFSGQYTIWICGPWPDRRMPPEEYAEWLGRTVPVPIGLYRYKRAEEIQQPYKFLFPIGISLFVSAGIVLLLWRRTEKRKFLRRRRRLKRVRVVGYHCLIKGLSGVAYV